MQPRDNILGYGLGSLQHEAALTSEIRVAGRGPALQDYQDMQYGDSRIMDKRPGMYLKYLPVRYDEVNGQLLSGGAYLFDTKKNVEAYDYWTSEEFRFGEPRAKFWPSPIFEFTAH